MGNGKIWPPADAKPLSVWYEGYTRAQVRVMWLPQTMKHLGSGHRDGPDHWIVSLPRYHRHSVLAFTVCATEFVWRPGHTGYWNAVATLSLTAWCFAETQHMITQRYAMAEKYGAGPAIARSWVRLPPVAAVYQRQLSVPSLRGRLMGSKPTGYGLQAKCGWSGWWYHGMSAVLRRESTVSPPPLILYRGQRMAAYRAAVPLAHANQLPLTSKIVKRCCSQVFSYKQRYIKYIHTVTFNIFTFTHNASAT